MRPLLSIVLFLFVVLASVPYLFITGIWASRLTRETISTNLVQAGVYQKFQDFLIQSAETKSEDGKSLSFLVPVITRELTPVYLQKKIETLLTDIESWINGGPPPALSFEDIKEKLLTQYGGTVSELKRFEKEAKAMKAEAAAQAKQRGEVFSTENIPSVSELLSKKAEIPLGPQLKPIYTVGVLVRRWWAITGGLLALLVGLALLAGSKASALRWIGATLLTVVILNILPVAGMLFASRAFLGLVSSKNVPEVAQTLILAFTEPIFTSYARVGVIMLGAAIFGSVICFITAGTMRSPQIGKSGRRKPA